MPSRFTAIRIRAAGVKILVCAGMILWSAGLILSSPANADDGAPSFSCARAATPAEHAICDTPGLGWYDRQLAKSWAVTLARVGKAGEAALKADQKAFLKTRDACVRSDDVYNCMTEAYLGRIRQLTEHFDDLPFAVGTYAGETGRVDLVRYPDRSVALTIMTVGGGDHTCTFETDTAKADPKGAIHWSEKPDPSYREACTITGTTRGGTLTIAAEGDGCTWYCGMRAELSGSFTARD